MEILLYLIIVLLFGIIILQIIFKPKTDASTLEILHKLGFLSENFSRLDGSLRDEFRVGREETGNLAKQNREELNDTLRTQQKEITEVLQKLAEQNEKSLDRINKTLEEKVTALIERTNQNLKENREELTKAIKLFSDVNSEQLTKITKQVEEKLTGLTQQAKDDNFQMRNELTKVFKEFQEVFDRNVKSFNDLQKEKFGELDKKQDVLIQNTEKKLEQMRETVDEKLQKTLNERLGQSFETVGKQLLAVQDGLGEMKNLAHDVGGLKKVLSNVKMRGNIGEVQLEMLLEQILAPDQYEKNVKIKLGSTEVVEFGIKLPGQDENIKQIWLPIDAKFPKDMYEHLQNAYDIADVDLIERAQTNLSNTIKKMARDISEKYINPPLTTDFAIMFLPFEGIYAEVVRKASLLEDLQRNYKVIVTGPSTLAAILNSLQMGFRTLAIQKRSSEVWQILGAVKKEFESFGGMLDKAQNNIQTGLNQLDDVMGKRTKAIQRKLRSVEALSETDTKLLLPETTDIEIAEEEA